MTSQDGWWIDSKIPVTPDDIWRFHQEAIDAGADPEAATRRLETAVKQAGGTIEDLAAAWTQQNERARNMADFREQLARWRQRRPM